MKKTNKKGFTLVELLAVIVILAVLILIALPNVMSIMNNARNNAFKDEAAAFISAAENQYMSDNATGCKLYSYDYSEKSDHTYNDNRSAISGTDFILTSMKRKNGYKAVIKINEGDAEISIANGKKKLENFTKEKVESKNEGDQPVNDAGTLSTPSCS